MSQNKKYLYLLLLIPLALVPMVIKSKYVLLLIDQVFVFIIAVMGMNFISGLTGENNLGMAGIFALGAYGTAIATVQFGLPTIVGVLISIVIGLIFGLLIGYPTLRLKGVYFALTTQVLAEAVRLYFNNAKELANGSNGIRNIPPLTLFGYTFSSKISMYYLFLVVCTLILIVAVRLINGRWGRELKAIRDNIDGVESCGVDKSSAKVKAFILCSVLGCLAGSMYAQLMTFILPTSFNYDLTVKFVMMLMLGGIGSVPGVVIGSTLVVILPETLRVLGDYYWLVFSILMLVIIIVRPYGLISIYEDLKGKHALKKSGAKGGGAE